MKVINSDQIKLLIIYNCLVYQKTKIVKYKLDAISDCHKLLKYYHIKYKRTIKKDLKDVLIDFSGWIGGSQVINELINAL